MSIHICIAAGTAAAVGVIVRVSIIGDTVIITIVIICSTPIDILLPVIAVLSLTMAGVMVAAVLMHPQSCD